ncbi:MAG: aldo/keto reductase [Actinomycetaceae bacterium]|nr:aldo/keto reductase [Actinomycetaceae bacterium]
MNLTDISIGIGTWYMGEQARLHDSEVAAIRHGLDLGLHVVDTAEMYGSGAAEELVGEAIAGRRDEVFLVTKVLPSNASARGTRRALEASLRRLRTDHVDLYLYHWRGGHPLAETVDALEEAVSDGLIGRWGVSNFDMSDMADLEEIGAVPAANQILYNLTRRGPEYDLLPYLRSAGIGIMAYSPLEQARLFHGRNGKHLAGIAADLGVTPATLALAWVVRDGGIVAIPKTSHRARMEENAAAASLKVDNSVLAELDVLFAPPTGPEPLEML